MFHTLACRPMTNPGDGHMDVSSSDESENTSKFVKFSLTKCQH